MATAKIIDVGAALEQVRQQEAADRQELTVFLELLRRAKRAEITGLTVKIPGPNRMKLLVECWPEDRDRFKLAVRETVGVGWNLTFVFGEPGSEMLWRETKARRATVWTASARDARANARKYRKLADRERNIRSAKDHTTEDTKFRRYVMACVLAYERRAEVEEEIARMYDEGGRE